MSTEQELLDRIAYLERDRDFWKGQQELAANVAATVADLDEEAPALRQMLRKEIERRKRAETAVDAVQYARQQAEAGRDHLKDENVHLHVQLARIRALHRQYRDVYATDETGDSCAHCNTFTDAWRVPWPCPTIQALDDPVFPAPEET